MKRTALYSMLVLSSLAAIVWIAGANVNRADSAKAEPVQTAEPSETSEPLPDIAKMVDPIRASESGLMPCPEERTCNGGSETCGGTHPCYAGTPGTPVDTGEPGCTTGFLNIFCEEAGQTIHIQQTPCYQCPCCSAHPACLCSGSCGYVQTWWCE
jgi:hypothetical protein